MYELSELNKKIKAVSLWTIVAALAAGLMSYLFLVKYLVGSFDIASWSAEQWGNSIMALLVVLVITSAQYFLYKANQKGFAASIGVLIVVTFGLFTEINNGMERSSSSVRERSQNSLVYKETVNAINIAASSNELNIPIDIINKIAIAERDLSRCEEKLKVGKEKHCAGAQSTVDSLKASRQAIIDGQIKSNAESQNNALKIADKAKELSFDEQQHFEFIKLLSLMLGVASVVSSFIFSCIVMGTFEYCFHYLASYESILRRDRNLLVKKNIGNKYENTEQASQPKQTPKTDYNNAVSAKTNSVSTVPTNLKQGSTELLTDTDNTDKVEVKELKNFGFAPASKQNGRPLSVPIQKDTDTEADTRNNDTEAYAKFISNVKSGMFKGKQSDITARQCKEWISNELNISKGKAQKLYEEWLDKAGSAGELKRNPKWTKSSRTNKWSIK